MTPATDTWLSRESFCFVFHQRGGPVTTNGHNYHGLRNHGFSYSKWTSFLKPIRLAVKWVGFRHTRGHG